MMSGSPIKKNSTVAHARVLSNRKKNIMKSQKKFNVFNLSAKVYEILQTTKFLLNY